MVHKHELPSWAEWRSGPPEFSVGIEEEIMIIDLATWNLTSQIETVMQNLPPALWTTTNYTA